MGMSKRLLEEIEEQEAKLRSIAIRAGALTTCELHEEVFDALGNHEEAIEQAKSLFASGELTGQFESEAEVVQTMERVIGESGMECGYCAKNAED